MALSSQEYIPSSSIELSDSPKTVLKMKTADLSLITSLYLSNRNLYKIGNISQAKNLVILQLNHNHLFNIEVLNQCTNLKELYLGNNDIVEIGNLNLTKLEKFDISNNKIRHVESIRTFIKLEHLCLNDNQVESIGGLEVLSELLELYVANNELREIKESICTLRELKQLIILDLNGNSCCNIKDYRRYAVYYLPNLKVLFVFIIGVGWKNRGKFRTGNIKRFFHRKINNRNAG